MVYTLQTFLSFGIFRSYRCSQTFHFIVLFHYHNLSQVSISDPTEIDMTMAAIEQRLKDVTFVHRVGSDDFYKVLSNLTSYKRHRFVKALCMI